MAGEQPRDHDYLRFVFNRSADPIFLVRTTTGDFVDISKRACDDLGYTRDELLELGVPDINPDFDSTAKFAHMMLSLPPDEPFTIESVHMRKDGSQYPVEVRGVTFEQGGELLSLAFAIDISERKRVESERERMLSRVVEAQEAERSRIARELHDSMAQNLMALGIRITTMQQEIGGGELHESLGVLRKHVQEIADETYAIVGRLRPPLLDELGLEEAIQRLLRGAAEGGLEVNATMRGNPEKIPGRVALTLYRVVQEAITNVQKHARAKELTVVCHCRKGLASVVVEDDGRGFDPKEATNSDCGGGFGLIGMRERMRAIGGVLEIESTVGGGTSVFGRCNWEEQP